MPLKIIRADGAAERVQIESMRSRNTEAGQKIKEAAASIMQDVKQNGFSAVCKYSVQFDGAEPREITRSELDEAYAVCDAALISALEEAARNIRSYHEQMLVQSWQWEREKGAMLGQVVRGLTRVGIYVPGGTAAYPSSVLMNAVPAKVAGVEEIIMVTPPTKNLNKAVLAAAKIAGVDRVIALGGVQAIAALTYGAGFIPKVDKIAGPGNAYVAEAKRIAYGEVDIDMVAGPSEVLVIADDTADARCVAADLLSQAEHDVLASAVLVTTSEALAARVSEELDRQTALLPRKDIVQQSLSAFAAAIVCGSIEACAAIANEVAPEHLEIMTERPRDVLPLIKNAGAVFLGAYSPEPLGDYMAGPCHVLPTSGTARFFSPLSTDSFLKKMSVIEYSAPCLETLARQTVALARSEGLDAHANSILVRFPDAGREEV